MGNKNNGNFMQMGYSCNPGCDNGCDACPANECACETETVCAASYPVQPNRCGKHGDSCCTGADETHVFFEACDGFKEVAVTGRCQEEDAPGRTLDVNCKLLNVCPGRRSALGITLTEMDEDGTEYARGFRAVTVPAHNARCNQDVNLDTVRFILPEDLSLQNRRHFIVRTQHHYLDASSIWNNGWGCKH